MTTAPAAAPAVAAPASAAVELPPMTVTQHGDTTRLSLGTPETPASAAPQVPPAAPTTERPSWLPEKFKSPEDLAKAYAALEAKQSQPRPAADPAGSTSTTPPAMTPAQAADTLKNAVLNMTEFSTEFSQAGNLSDASYEKLEKAGIPKAMVESYIAGQEAIATNTRNEVFIVVGGEEKYGAMTDWAKASLPRAEIEAYNSAIDSGNLDQIKLAVAGMNSKFVAANGQEPSLVRATTTPSVGTDVFNSTAEIIAAINDPRYRNDPAYRRSIEQKVGRSSVF